MPELVAAAITSIRRMTFVEPEPIDIDARARARVDPLPNGPER